MNQTLRIAVAALAFLPVLTQSAYPASPSVTSVRLGEQALAFSSGFIRDEVPIAGAVIKTAFNREILGQKDTLYLRLKSLDDVETGSLFTVYRRIHKVFHPVSRRYLGNLYMILGVARVVRLDGDLATAKVERSYGSIYPGDLLMPFELPPAERTELDELLPETPGMIVDMQSPRTLVAQGNVVYIDWGRQEGLKAGDRLQVLRKRFGFPTEPIGEVRVLWVEETSATGVVVRSVTPIAVSDLVVGMEPAQTPGVSATDTAVTMATTTKPTAGREQLKRSLAADIAKGDVSVTEIGNTMTISLNDLVDQLEYDPGEARIKPTGLRILKQIADYLKGQSNQQIVVEGHTDNMPIGPSLLKHYPTNKELSDARAQLIVKYFAEQGIEPVLMSSIGLADRRPVDTNKTEEGRRKNRRIEIVLIPYGEAAPAQSNSPKPSRDAKAQTFEPVKPQADPEPWRINLPKPLAPVAMTTGTPDGHDTQPQQIEGLSPANEQPSDDDRPSSAVETAPALPFQ